MEKLNYLRDLLCLPSADGDSHARDFLKKYLLLCHLGELRINGQLPNNAFGLADYLLDDKRVMIDWSRLSKVSRQRLKHWLIVKHQATLRSRAFDNYKIDEQGGVAVERRIGWFEQFTNSIFWFKHRYFSWPLKTQFFSSDFQLSRIDICLSQRGCLVDLIPRFQLGKTESSLCAADYHAPHQEQNVKRVLLNDTIVAKLLNTDINAVDYEHVIYEAHPTAVKVLNPTLRTARIQLHRLNNGFSHTTSWLYRLFHRLKHWFLNLLELSTTTRHTPHFQPLQSDKQSAYSEDDFRLSRDRVTGEVLFVERRPLIDTFTFSGGGAKLVAHLGAVSEFIEEGVIAKHFKGSSGGAIMALLLYLGYDSEKIQALFQWFRQENLITCGVSIAGRALPFNSTTDKLKQALDWLVLNKVFEIMDNHAQFFESGVGLNFVQRHLLAKHQLTFKALGQLKSWFPECGLGESLSVTATNVTTQETDMLSLVTTPDKEVSEAVKISASLPLVFHSTKIKHPLTGEETEYVDGGVTENIPMSACQDRGESILRHATNADPSTIVFIINTGPEEETMHSQRPLYKEGAVENFVYSMFSGIANSAAAWERERRRLRFNYPLQAVVSDVDITTKEFNLSQERLQQSIDNGRKAARAYITSHFYDVVNHQADADNDGPVVMRRVDETSQLYPMKKRAGYMYRQFENCQALLLYIARREKWAELYEVNRQIQRCEHITVERKSYLADCYQQLVTTRNDAVFVPAADNFYSEDEGAVQEKLYRYIAIPNKAPLIDIDELRLFRVLFPLLAQAWSRLTTLTSADLGLFIQKLNDIRDNLTPNTAKESFLNLKDLLSALSGSQHLLLYLFKCIMSHASVAAIDSLTKQVNILVNLWTKPSLYASLFSAHYVGDFTIATREHLDSVLADLFAIANQQPAAFSSDVLPPELSAVLFTLGKRATSQGVKMSRVVTDNGARFQTKRHEEKMHEDNDSFSGNAPGVSVGFLMS